MNENKQILTITDSALNRAKFLINKTDSDVIGLRVGIKTAGCSGLKYNIEYAKEIKPHEIPYMKNEEIFPENWNHIKTTLEKKVESLKNNKNISITDQFKCGKCNKRECSYYELQIRSADESATLFITCLNCNAKWRQ